MYNVKSSVIAGIALELITTLFYEHHINRFHSFKPICVSKHYFSGVASYFSSNLKVIWDDQFE